MSTPAGLPHSQTWAEPSLRFPPATSRAHHADPLQSSCDRRVFRSFPTFVLFGGQRRGRSAVERSCRGGGQQLFPVGPGARTRCCAKVSQEISRWSRRAQGRSSGGARRGQDDPQRGQREREEVRGVCFFLLCRLWATFCAWPHVCTRRGSAAALLFLVLRKLKSECQRLTEAGGLPPSNCLHCAQGRRLSQFDQSGAWLRPIFVSFVGLNHALMSEMWGENMTNGIRWGCWQAWQWTAAQQNEK